MEMLSKVKNSAFRPGRGLLSIAAYKSIRYVLRCLINPVHLFSARYRSILPSLVAKFLTVHLRKFRLNFCIKIYTWNFF